MTVYRKAIDERMMATIASYMDDEIREDLNFKLAPCTHEEFITAYLERDPEFLVLLENEFDFDADAIEVARLFVSADRSRAILADEELSGIYKAYGLNNVLCCDAEGLIETEELEEISIEHVNEFDWTEEV